MYKNSTGCPTHSITYFLFFSSWTSTSTLFDTHNSGHPAAVASCWGPFFFALSELVGPPSFDRWFGSLWFVDRTANAHTHTFPLEKVFSFQMCPPFRWINNSATFTWAIFVSTLSKTWKKKPKNKSLLYNIIGNKPPLIDKQTGKPNSLPQSFDTLMMKLWFCK